MKRVLTAVILIPIVVIALFRAPLWLFTALVAGVAMLAAYEYFTIAFATGFRPSRFLGYVFLAMPFLMLGVVTHLAKMQSAHLPLDTVLAAFVGASPVFLLLIPLVFLCASLRADPLSRSLADAAIGYLLLPYVGFTLIIMPMLRGTSEGALYLLFVMLLVWCGDIGAYYVGRAIGRHKLAPRISPGKTWEGALASVLTAVVVGLLLFHFVNAIAAAFYRVHLLVPSPATVLENKPPQFGLPPWWSAVLLAVCVNVAAQVGDLVESALKRGAGLKDSGTLLPGHGGVLDRIDALLFALPVGLVFYIFGMGKYFEQQGPR